MEKTIIAAQLKLQNSWLLNAIEGITEEESVLNVEGLNRLKWIVGHILSSRMVLVSAFTGEDLEENYGLLFGKGTVYDEQVVYPSLHELREKWLELANQSVTVVESVDFTGLEGKPLFQTAIPDTTKHGFIAYFSMHESHHIGQLSVLRKLLGKGPMNMGRNPEMV